MPNCKYEAQDCSEIVGKKNRAQQQLFRGLGINNGKWETGSIYQTSTKTQRVEGAFPVGTAASQTKLQKCRNRWRNPQKGLEVTYKTVEMGAPTMNPPKHRGSMCYIAMERFANPTKTQKCRNRWRNPEKALQVVQKMQTWENLQ